MYHLSSPSPPREKTETSQTLPGRHPREARDQMAAAQYYNPGGGGGGGMPQAPQQAPYQAPVRPLGPPQQTTMNPLPYPISDAPPPYTLFADQNGVNRSQSHSQPPPQNRPPIHPNYTAQGSGYPPEQNAYPAEKPNVHFSPTSQSSGPSYPPQQPPRPGQLGYPYPNWVPPAAMSQVYGDPNRRTSTLGYQPSSPSYREYFRSRSRSRSRDRRRHHHHQHDRPEPTRKKSNGVSTFLGAGGGALIGDAIFPGLGTLGGAILGGVGGHEYGKQRRSYSNPNRTKMNRSYSNDRVYDHYDDDYDKRGRKRY